MRRRIALQSASREIHEERPLCFAELLECARVVASCLVRFENITDAADGVDELDLEWVVHFRAQPAHNDVNHVRGSFESDFPHVFCNLSARHDFATRANQMSEHKKFLRRKIEC